VQLTVREMNSFEWKNKRRFIFYLPTSMSSVSIMTDRAPRLVSL
jgi:hypothetical protein